jgi:hypothetical protein
MLKFMSLHKSGKTVDRDLFLVNWVSGSLNVDESKLTRSATPPGRMVLTTTPVLRPPIMPKAKPDPSLIKSITSTWAHSVFNWK